MSRSRIIGTVEEALQIEESLLGRKLPRSFRNWLLENNGLDIGEVHIYPVRDERDTRKTRHPKNLGILVLPFAK